MWCVGLCKYWRVRRKRDRWRGCEGSGREVGLKGRWGCQDSIVEVDEGGEGTEGQVGMYGDCGRC